MNPQELYQSAIKEIEKRHGRPPTFKRIARVSSVKVKYSEKRKWRPNYINYINSKAWRVRREQLPQYSCFVCGTKNNLTTHHNTYKRLGREKNRDLVRLCWPCHQESHELALNEQGVNLKNAHKILKKLKLLEIK